ncbi:hypothetical protein NC652_012643 [Populus alba x Populus x berolinensis]|uniref:Uncharacterized protein n=1 Tax=Populus alba x Populus x berolinensis TaxID=444605 RepID=A0AAD6QTB4_9ROSI|nr:hypothetical protein NC652_012643 [Populus alba x Populus x berolinensis]KAJ6995840.1 hypothetical protein NC653_012648 [Populus alba x Populus x berolinensis]
MGVDCVVTGEATVEGEGPTQPNTPSDVGSFVCLKVGPCQLKTIEFQEMLLVYSKIWNLGLIFLNILMLPSL